LYFHIGNGVQVRRSDVIGIFDLDTSTVSKTTRKFVNENERAGNLSYSDTDLPRTFILTEEKGKYKIRLSRISSSGIKSRAESNYIYD
jgi:hypothetical protein